MKNLTLFIFPLVSVLLMAVIFSSVGYEIGLSTPGDERLSGHEKMATYVVGKVRNEKAEIVQSPRLKKALKSHFEGKRMLTDLRIASDANDFFLVLTAKEKDGSTSEIAYELVRKGINLEATAAASETCSGCSHCAFATEGGCVCVEEGSCTHSTTRDSLMDILETEGF
ncbi:hypothetical protein [Cyclobacterium salsum]|uniref:hypothetical protein n=1 Tax=Cyclobacterium salsum TaxID=2666329 RepID=UPI0013907DBF|nr:hypothetical protein [Cyclobacterium salsum]